MSRLPNLITLLRLALTPVIAWAIWGNDWQLAGILFSLAALSDAIDGWLARKLSARSRLGELLDPLADKALINAAMIGCAMAGLLPLWLAILIAVRDILILAGASITHSFRLSQSLLPLLIGKASTAGQMSLIALALIGMATSAALPAWMIPLLVGATALLTVISGMAYGRQWLAHFIPAGHKPS